MTQDVTTPPSSSGDNSVDDLGERLEALANTLQALIRSLPPEQRTGFTSHLNGLTRKGSSRIYAEMIARMR